MAGPKKGGNRNDNRPGGKAWKKVVYVFSPEKRRLVRQENPKK